MSYMMQSAPVRIALQQAVEHHRKGRLREAEQMYRSILEKHPGQADAGRNLLGVLFATGRLAEMESQASILVEQTPKSGLAWKGLGLSQLAQDKDALHAWRMATKYLPDDAEAYENLGIALKRAGQFEEAADSFHRAIKFNPRSAGAYVNLGNAQKECGQFDAAMTSYRRALEIQPGLVEAHNNLANLLRERGQMEDAIRIYRQAIALKPDLAEAHTNLGRVLRDLGRLAEAEACLRRALEIKPNNADTLYNLGAILHDQNRAEEAQACYRRALELAPDNAMVRIGQAMLALPVVAQDEAQAQQAPVRFGRSLEELAAWMESAPQASQHIDPTVLQLPFYLAYRDGNHAALLSRHADLVTRHREPNALSRTPQRARQRLVVVSQHFRRHSVWDVITRGILSHIDRSRFELVLYHLGHLEDEETLYAKSLADTWRDLRSVAGLRGWLDAMAADQPDVIFYPEIGLDSTTFHLASRRLAPLQVVAWGHPITSGLKSIDLFFSGELLEPDNADAHYRERLVRLPGTGCCTAPVAHAPEGKEELEALLAGRRSPRFMIAQMPFKLGPSDDALFARIAAAVGECTFILFAHPQFGWATEQLTARIGKAFRAQGLDPERHLLVLPWLPQAKFYALLDLCDVYLDCPSFSGYTTAWMAAHRGMPVVTLEGRFMRQRLAAGLLRKIGATGSIAATPDEYEAIAVRLAAESRDPQARTERREQLKAAAPRADHDVSVVRAFERHLIPTA